MSELLKIIISLSLSGTLLIFILFLCKPLVKDKLSKRWQYYIWLIVIVRLLFPFTPQKNLMSILFQQFDNSVIQTNINPEPKLNNPTFTNFINYNKFDTSTDEVLKPKGLSLQDIFNIVTQNIEVICVLVWLIVAISLLIRKITIYQSFVKYIKVGQIEISDIKLWEQVGELTEKIGVKGTVGLYTNSLISSPLLIGFFRPYIMLPTTKLPDSDFQYTILHELTHYKRQDMLYKWLVQITICFHWFNPFVYLMGQEINRACELSCDEIVIRSLDKQERQAYGDTLLNAMEMGGMYKNEVASLTLNESKELLKERLDAIMKFKKQSKIVIIITVMLTMFITIGASYMGRYTVTNIHNTKLQTNISNKPSLTLDISSAAVDLKTATDGKISADYNSNIYDVQINTQNNAWRVKIASKKTINTNTETINLYIPDINYSDIKMNVNSAYLTSSIIKSGNIIGDFNTASVLLTLPKGFSGSLDTTVTSGYFELVSQDDFNNTNTTIVDDGEIGEVYAPKSFIKDGNKFTFTHGTKANLIKVTRKGTGVIGIYSPNYSASVDIPSDWQSEWENQWWKSWNNSWQTDNNNTVTNKGKKAIIITPAEPFRVTAGQGKNQSSDYSENKHLVFSVTKGQKVQIDVDEISDFHGGEGYNIKLIFKDYKNHIVEVSLGDSEKEEVIFENAGLYSLTIQNDEDVSLKYSFILQ